MEIKGFALLRCEKNKYTGIFQIEASFWNSGKYDFYETREWSSDDLWPNIEPEEMDEFAIGYHTVYEIRKKYPIISLIINKFDTDEGKDISIEHHGFFETGLDIQYTPSYHEGFVQSENISSSLLSLGSKGDFKQFSEAIYSPGSRYWFTFLLSEQEISIEKVKSSLESADNSNAFQLILLDYFNVVLYITPEGDIRVITRDEEIVKNFLANPRHPNAKKKFFNVKF